MNEMDWKSERTTNEQGKQKFKCSDDDDDDDRMSENERECVKVTKRWQIRWNKMLCQNNKMPFQRRYDSIFMFSHVEQKCNNTLSLSI